MPSDRHTAVRLAIVAGDLRPLSACCCKSCGVRFGRAAGELDNRWNLVYHHPDPADFLFVVPLCRSCHGKVHAGLIVEPVTGRWYPCRWPARKAA